MVPLIFFPESSFYGRPARDFELFFSCLGEGTRLFFPPPFFLRFSLPFFSSKRPLFFGPFQRFFSLPVPFFCLPPWRSARLAEFLLLFPGRGSPFHPTRGARPEACAPDGRRSKRWDRYIRGRIARASVRRPAHPPPRKADPRRPRRPDFSPDFWASNTFFSLFLPPPSSFFTSRSFSGRRTPACISAPGVVVSAPSFFPPPLFFFGFFFSP